MVYKRVTIFIRLYFTMKFEIRKKTLIIIVSSVVGVILLWGILSVVGHGRYERNNFGRNFGNYGCAMGQWRQWNPDTMMSWMQNIIATKDYAAFQTLFSGTKMVEQIDTPAKFAIRVELQTTMKTAQDLETKLWSGINGDFGPMMSNATCAQWQRQGWRWENERWNMMRRR